MEFLHLIKIRHEWEILLYESLLVVLFGEIPERSHETVIPSFDSMQLHIPETTITPPLSEPMHLFELLIL